MPNSLTAAVAGTGFIGPVHVEALQRAGVSVAGILGSTPGKIQVGSTVSRFTKSLSIAGRNLQRS